MFYGNFGMHVRALAYIMANGPEGLRQTTEDAVLNANYIRKKLEGVYDLPYSTPTMHEVVFSDRLQNPKGIRTGDIAKRLIDYGFHPYTVSFPLVVHGALMIEPTESESKEELDQFIDAMKAIAEEAEQHPGDHCRGAAQHPHLAPGRDHRRAQAGAALEATSRGGGEVETHLALGSWHLAIGSCPNPNLLLGRNLLKQFLGCCNRLERARLQPRRSVLHELGL